MSNESLKYPDSILGDSTTSPGYSAPKGRHWNEAPQNQDELITPHLRSILKRNGLFGLGEEYIRGSWDAADLRELLYQIVIREDLGLSKFNPRVLLQLGKELIFDLQRGKKAFEVGERHYDLGNDLFAAMLDSSMSYTCGYWGNNARSLEDSQADKLKLLCQKLNLQPGMRVLDIGCGWGNFADFAARNYGISVVGLTISKEQAQFATARCKDLPVKILIEDYRHHIGKYDRIVSIEMIEAVGRKNVPLFFDVVERSLESHGLFALQVISAETFNRRSSVALDHFVVWLQKYVFPNGYLPKIGELVSAPSRQLVLEDLHNFSSDYDRTLQAWSQNFEQAWPSLADKYGEEFHRMWRFYLYGCMAFFRSRVVQLYQVVYSKGGVPGGYRQPARQ